MSEERLSARLADTGQIYVTLRAAREYAEGVYEEHARRELTERLLDARRAPGQDRPPYESWRVRGEIALSALVSREGPLAVVVTVHMRRRR